MRSKNGDDHVLGLFTLGNCQHCRQAKILLKEDLKSGKVKELPVELERWKSLAIKHGIKGVPQLVKLSKTEFSEDGKTPKLVGKCSLDKYQKTKKC